MNRLKELREKRGLRQSDLAAIFKITQGTLSNWEVERHDIDTRNLFKLADFFNVTTDYLLGKDDGEIPNANLGQKRAELNEIFNAKNGAYFRLAKSAKELDLSEHDIDIILDFFKRGEEQE